MIENIVSLTFLQAVVAVTVSTGVILLGAFLCLKRNETSLSATAEASQPPRAILRVKTGSGILLVLIGLSALISVLIAHWYLVILPILAAGGAAKLTSSDGMLR